MKIKIELTEFETIVLRAALANHQAKCPNDKHLAACKEIDRKSRLQDNPLGIVRRMKKREEDAA